MFKRLLIANRGEIALRILRACRELGIETVCVVSSADRHAPYLAMADRTICIGPPAAKESYLKSDRIIAAAEVANAEAIHPGYGFLAENAQFADQCRQSNIEFIGPTAESMRLLGDKASARKLAQKTKIAVVPGSDLVETDDEAAEEAAKIGYPVMIKASAGGGGRGLRIAHQETELRRALSQSRQESMAAFKHGGLYLEKLIERPRHVEVQVLADHHGHVVHLYERDCTVQRRYQKLVEETPSPGLNSRTRDHLCRAAVRLAKAASYTNAGTFEFLVDDKGSFYFIEANTRVQVEHPITEMITGVDIIKAQVRIAAGEPLPFAQRDIRVHGAAMECRINAEDPAHGFRPSPGRVEKFIPPGGFGVRLDTHVRAGYTIAPHYDSLIGKLIVHQNTRAEAIKSMRRCLDEFVICPIKTTIPFHRALFEHPSFVAGDFDTHFVERSWPPGGPPG